MILFVVDSNMLTHSDLHFWRNIFIDHAEFLSELLKPSMVPNLIQESIQMRYMWERYDVHRDEILPLIKKTLMLKNKVLSSAISTAKPINVKLPKEDFVAVVVHMIEEATYVEASLVRTLSRGEELAFWMRHSEEDTKLAADAILNSPHLKHMLYQLLAQMKIASPQQQLELFLEFDIKSKELASYIRSGQVQSLMDLKMLIHEIEETAYAREKLKELGLFYD